jgi:hypothetical protein
MVQSLETLLLMFGGPAVLLALLGFFGRSLVEILLTNDVAKFKANLESASQITIERLRADLRLTAFEHEVRFSRLHDKRAEILAELYSLLVAAVSENKSYASQSDSGSLAKKREKYGRAADATDEFFKYYDRRRIYLPEPICEMLDSFDLQLRRPTSKFWAFGRIEDPSPETFQKMNEAWDRAWESVTNDIPKLRAAIEIEFRRLLGALP